jgi:LuxR family maltose regulon positive regulatory protein
MSAPVVLVLDDVHVLSNREGRDALSVLAEHVPAGSLLVLSGRDAPPLPVARLRAEGRIVEIGQVDLALTREAAAALLKDAGLSLGETEVREVHRRTEGWPAGVYLAALCLRQGGTMPGHTVSFGGDDRLVAEYIESEFLSRISEHDRLFLTRTAVLDRLTGPLCEAVLDMPGSAATLDDLARSNLLLVPLDRRRRWYRYHRLFRDMLLSELERRDPSLIPVLQRRASTWYAENGLADQAVEYAIAAGDVSQTARLVDQLGLAAFRQGRTGTLDRWLSWLADRGAIEQRPTLMVQACICSAMGGRPAEADRWADAIDRWQYGDRSEAGGPRRRSVGGRVASRPVSRRRRADARRRRRRDRGTHRRRHYTGRGLDKAGVSRMPSAATSRLRTRCWLTRLTPAGMLSRRTVLVQGLCQRASLAMARGDWGLGGGNWGPRPLLSCATRGWPELRDASRVRNASAGGGAPRTYRRRASRTGQLAQRLRPMLTYALPCPLPPRGSSWPARTSLWLTSPAPGPSCGRSIRS